MPARRQADAKQAVIRDQLDAIRQKRVAGATWKDIAAWLLEEFGLGTEDGDPWSPGYVHRAVSRAMRQREIDAGTPRSAPEKRVKELARAGAAEAMDVRYDELMRELVALRQALEAKSAQPIPMMVQPPVSDRMLTARMVAGEDSTLAMLMARIQELEADRALIRDLEAQIEALKRQGSRGLDTGQTDTDIPNNATQQGGAAGGDDKELPKNKKAKPASPSRGARRPDDDFANAPTSKHLNQSSDQKKE